MNLYSIINRSEQDIARPVYRLSHSRESLAGYRNHLTFLTRCRNNGIIPNRLQVTLPVRSPKANCIPQLTSLVLLCERISEAHKMTTAAEQLTSQLKAHLQSVTPEQWSDLDEYSIIKQGMI